MTTKFKTLSFLTLGATLVAQAQNGQPVLAAADAASAPTLSPLEQSIKDLKNPVSWLSWGGDLRLRNEYLNNARSLTDKVANHEQDYFRFRARVWAAIKPVDDLSLNVRLSTEPREYMNPSNSGAFGVGRTGWDWTYGIIDQLNVQYKNAFGLPATITVGRQDISLNDNWLMGDGTPLDGSWTYYMDAARLTYDLKDQKTVIDVIGLAQFARADAWLPTINEQDRALCDQNEKGAILNVSNKTIKQANLDGYFMYKHDTRLNNLDRPSGTTGDNADIYTVGGRLSGLLGENWKYSAEGAYQFGEKQDPRLGATPLANTPFRDISAFGVNTKAFYLVKDSMNNQIGLNYEYLTGDNPGTGNDEMFDVMWGRYPRWTDLYTFSLAPEARIAQYANYHRFGPTWAFTPVKNLDFSASYFALFADQSTPTRASNPALFSRDGSFRGHYVQSILKYKFNSHLAALLQGELLFPGDYYTTHPMMSFVRAEVTLTF